MRLQLVTLGCSKNRVDSEFLLRQAVAAGIEIAPEDEPLDKGGIDVVVLNTCGFIGDAKKESIDTIMMAVKAKNEGWISAIYVFGCLSVRYRKKLKSLIPEVDGFFTTQNDSGLLAALGINENPLLSNSRYLTTPPHYAYLKISEGCDRSCSYCAIPGIRGKHVSVPMEDLLQQARDLAAAGVRELIVIAQDTTYYGLDLYKKRMLGTLLERLAEVDGIEWIRLHYCYPDAFPEDVLNVMASNDKICKYIDIPLQHSSTTVLKMMRRNVDREHQCALVRKFREAVPGVVLRTTMIVGHPGEGIKEFRDLLSFVEESCFERLGAFTYSEEEGTYGAAHYKDIITPLTKRRRYNSLMQLQSDISLKFNQSRIGSQVKVVVDSFEDGILCCRSQYESPEVDGQILVKAPDIVPADIVGKFIIVKITAADSYDLAAEMV